jgi:hypothetical protein
MKYHVPPLPMKQNTTLLVLGLALTITAALAVAPILSEMAYAVKSSASGGNVCDNSAAGENNPHCNPNHVCGNSGAGENNPHCRGV